MVAHCGWLVLASFVFVTLSRKSQPVEHFIIRKVSGKSFDVGHTR